MTRPDTLSLYLPDVPLARAREGRNPMAQRLEALARARRLRFMLRPLDAEQRLKALGRSEFAICHTVPPFAEGMLVMRPAYLPAFWRIEDSADRWRFEVASRPFAPEELNARNAKLFVRDLAKRRFGASMRPPSRGGYVYVPLQGDLSVKRGFQHAAPLDMLVAALSHAEGRRVIATLHPTAKLGDWEQGALTRIAADNPRLSIESGPATDWLPGCDYVVTQNSGAAFEGFFWGKPAVLFARSDFHHICANVGTLGVEGAFAEAERMLADPPDFERYLTWFIRDNCINPANAHSTRRIAAILGRRGWDLPPAR